MNQNNSLETVIQFIIRISDTPEGFCLERTDTKTNFVDLIFKSTSYSIVYKIFTEQLKSIDPGWFRIIKLSISTADTRAIYIPIQQYNLKKSE